MDYGATQVEYILRCPVAVLPHLTGTLSIRDLWFAEPLWGEESVLWRPSPKTTKAIITLRAEMLDCRIIVVN